MVDNIFYTQAIQSLRPNEGFTIDDMDYSTLKFSDETVNKPSEMEIHEKFLEIKTTYDNAEYQRLRKIEYDGLNQFELQFNDAINGTSTWIDSINAIKVKYPKPV